jgi:ubiquinone/menaquinone biosynthesis C-methylase UbiE
MPRHRPEIFEVDSLGQARSIILTPDGATTDQRWATETPWLVDLLGRQLVPQPGTVLLDYGCGIGRLARPLIEQFGCAVVGVDASRSMRLLAPQYVESERFVVGAPDALDHLLDHGLTCDHAYAVWALQHCLWPDQDIARVRRAVRPGGCFSVINARTRIVPVDGGWLDDGVSIEALLDANGFTALESVALPPDVAPPAIVAHACLTLYRRN